MENNESKTPQTAPQAAEQKDILSTLKASKKQIIGVCVAAVVVIAAVFAWSYFDGQASSKADEAVALADLEANDSIAVELYKEAAALGHKSGNRAKLMVAISLYQDGKYDEALTYLEDADIDDSVVKAGALTLAGDCYVNTEKYDEALASYDEALSAADENPTISPVILFKKANVYRAQQNFAGEYEALKEIIEEYPTYDANVQADIRRYYERAKAAAGK